MRHARSATARSRPPLAGLVVSGLLLLIGLAGLIWRLTGGRWLIVATASMGRTAPVGSLVLLRPVEASAVRVGDIVSYHPPAVVTETITHRVVRIDAAGLLHTQGDINAAPDAWALGSRDLVGRVVSIWWGWGWLIKALPLLIVGALLVWGATRLWATDRWRVPLRIFGFTILVAIESWLLRPWVNLTLLGTTTDASGTHATVVSTGLLPIRVSAATGGFVDLVDGQVGVVTTHLPSGVNGARLSSLPHLTFGQWIGLILLWLVPVFYVLLVGLLAGRDERPPDLPDGGAGRRPAVDPESDDAATAAGYSAADPGLLTHLTRRRRRWRPRWAAVGLVAVLAVGMAEPTTSAAFVAKMTNTTDTATATAYFTCAGATASVTAANTLFTYPLSDSSVATNASAADTSGNAHNGTYSAGFSTTTSRPCTRDTTTTAVTLAPTLALPTYVYSSAKVFATNTFTEIVWFKTTTTTGGRMIGWSTAQTGQSSVYDRHIYMTNAGTLVFGVYPSAVKTVASTLAYNDGNWHQVAASLSTAGMALYVDGALVASDTSTIYGENSGGTVGGTPVEQGYWRVGYDNLSGWTSAPTTNYWTGSLAWASVFTTALTAAQVKTLYLAGV